MTNEVKIFDQKAFNSWLLNWYKNTNEKTVGDVGNFGQQAFLWIEENEMKYRLNADTKREGVKEYLQLLDENNGSIKWVVVANLKGKMNKIAFGDNAIKIRGFYLYLII